MTPAKHIVKVTYDLADVVETEGAGAHPTVARGRSGTREERGRRCLLQGQAPRAVL